MPPKRGRSKNVAKRGSRSRSASETKRSSRSRTRSRSSSRSPLKLLKLTKDPFKNDEIHRYNEKMKILHANGDKLEMKRLENIYNEFNAAREELHNLLNTEDEDAFSRKYKRVAELRKEFGIATIGEEAVRQHEEKTNAAVEEQSEAAERDFEEWAEAYRAEKINNVIKRSGYFDKTKIVDSVRDGKESNCPICLEHLSNGKDAGDVYAIDTERCKMSKNIKKAISCGHKFHENCINAWMNNSEKCPMCKGVVKKIRKAPEEPIEKAGGKKNKKFSVNNKKNGKRRTVKKSFFDFFS